MQEMEDFRAGYFDLHIQRIGFYKDAPTTVDVQQAGDPSNSDNLLMPWRMGTNPNSSVLVKLVSSVLRLVFSEQANRRRSAMTIWTQKRGLTRIQTMVLGIQIRRKRMGLFRSVFTTTCIVLSDLTRTVMAWVLRYAVFYPGKVIGRIGKNTSFIK